MGRVRIVLGVILYLCGQVTFAQEDAVPGVFIYQESQPFTAVLVEKATQTFWLYGKNTEGSLVVRHHFPCSTGEISGDKQVSGDKKTPEGVYFFLTEFEQRYLAPIYGTGAFPIDYPNYMDLRAGKTGNAIWLHGTNRALRPQDTNGCIALENHNLDTIRGEIQILRSPMIVVENLALQQDPSAEEAAAFKARIHAWKDSLWRASYHAYLAFYDPDFLPEIVWWPEWVKLREKLEKEMGSLSLVIEDLDIFRVGNRVTAIFDLALRSGEIRQNLGRRLLYLEPDAHQEMRIVGDPWLSPPESPVSVGDLLLTGLRELDERGNAEGQVLRMVDDWLEAWSSQKMEVYGTFYAREFRSQGRDRRAWIRYKEGLSRSYTYINVTREGDVQVQMHGKDRAAAYFTQKYNSSGFETRGRKRLDLIREGGRWKIYREIWEG